MPKDVKPGKVQFEPGQAKGGSATKSYTPEIAAACKEASRKLGSLKRERYLMSANVRAFERTNLIVFVRMVTYLQRQRRH